MMAFDQQSEPSLSDRLVGGPAGFRQLLQRLGPTFIKIGQFLALRPDLVSQEYCDELMKLLDRVPPFPWGEAKEVLRSELDRDPAEIFAFINPRPVAAGSLAQAHFARLKDGSEVAIKIQRPNIRERILKDLKRARILARLFEMSGVSLVASPQEVVQELTEWMMQEIDFRREVNNMSRLYRLSSGTPNHRIPFAYPELSSQRVLTAEYLRGVAVSEILVALGSGKRGGEERVAALGVDRDQLAANLFNSALTQIFRYQFFHADLHPGNLIVLPGNVLGFVDFGLCDDLDETVRDRQLRYLTAVYSGDTERMFKALLEILIPSEKTDLEAFRRDFFERTSAWRVRRRAAIESGGSWQADRSPTSAYLVDVMRSARRNQLQVPPRILSMYRTLLTAESVASRLVDRLELRMVGRRFFTGLQIDEAVRALDLQKLQPTLLSFFALLRDSPGQLQQILSELASGRFNINVEVGETRREAQASNRRTRLIAATIASVGLAVLISGDAWPESGETPFRWMSYAALTVIYIYILVQWYRLS